MTYPIKEEAFCRHCSHAIILKEIEENNQKVQRWFHYIPINATTFCNFKSCSCGGNGFEIYGIKQRFQTCGMCGKGQICNCATPEPMVVIQNGQEI